MGDGDWRDTHRQSDVCERLLQLGLLDHITLTIEPNKDMTHSLYEGTFN